MNKGTLYTSYFANWRKYKELDSFLISITRFPPKYINFKAEGICNWSILAPSKELLLAYKDGSITKDDFRTKYILQISQNTEVTKAINVIKDSLNNGANVTLLCYEKSEDFCHRHILAEIFDEAGYNIKEI